MEYPLISEYREAILCAEDNFNELASLRPVLDSHGDPVMSSGNFAVVFKMRDENDGKCYAVKCFIKDQQGRDESYRKITEELEIISSSYILPLRYLENELFVDSSQCDCEEFPVVVMEWVEGETLDAYLKRNINDKYELEILSYRFNRMAAWLFAQPFAHGDLKTDNILIRKDGSLVLVDYDGMFVPSMKGEKAREIGSPDYRHPLRTDSDFNEHIDDFSIAVIALSLKAIALNPQLKSQTVSGDSLLPSEKDFRSPSDSTILKDIQKLTADSELQMLMGIFYIALAKNSLDSISFRLFITAKPKQPIKLKPQPPKPAEKIDTSCTDKDIAEGIADEFGVIYSKDGKRLLKRKSRTKFREYTIKYGTQIICDSSFRYCHSLHNIEIPDTVIAIGNDVFKGCPNLKRVIIPDSVNSIGDYAFNDCLAIKSITIPNSVTELGNNPFSGCPNLNVSLQPHSNFCIINNLLIDSNGILVSNLNNSEFIIIPDSVIAIGKWAFHKSHNLQRITIPTSVKGIEMCAFRDCICLHSVQIPESVTKIEKMAFQGCVSLQNILIPKSVTTIGNQAFKKCSSLQRIEIPDSVTTLGDCAFRDCQSLHSIVISKSITVIKQYTFDNCTSLQSITIPDSVTAIEDNTFTGCSSLQSIVIPNSVTTLGSRSFGGCSSLQNIKISTSIKVIEYQTFIGCSTLQSIDLPNSVKAIRNEAFCRCSSLQNFIIPNSVTSIDNKVFMECSSLQSVIIPNSVSKLGINPFCGCKNIKIKILSRSYFRIINKLLIDHTGVLISCLNNSKKIVIPNSVSIIGECAFKDFLNLQGIVIPESVTEIRNEAFENCTSLQNIIILNPFTTIGYNAFSGCSSLKTVNIPQSNKIGFDVFPKECEIVYL